MMNKKAWIKIVEAFIAVLIITSVLLVIYSSGRTSAENTGIYKIEDSLLGEITKNEQLRQDVLDLNKVRINEMISERILPSLNFTIRICKPEDICGMQEYKGDVYARERIVSSTLDEYAPRKLKLFMWEK